MTRAFLATAPIAIFVLLLGAAFPQMPPTARGLADPASYHSVWNVRLAGANIFELGMLVVVGLWAIRARTEGVGRSSFDRLVLGVCLFVAIFTVLDVPRHIATAEFLGLDVERMLVALAGYFVVTRFVRDHESWSRITWVLAAVVVVRATELVLVHGVFGSTEFGTSTGQMALLITEDCVLLALPALLAWGVVLERRASLWRVLGALALIGAILLVDFLSLRRGGLIFISGALALRALTLPRIVTLPLAVGAVIALIALGTVGSSAPELKNASYVVRSTLLLTHDASSRIRENELANFGHNVHGVDWAIGRGPGVTWRLVGPGPIDLAAFGSKETPSNRIGWHVYMLDWGYKFGLLGVAVLTVFFVAYGRRVLGAFRRSVARDRTLVAALGLSSAIFFLFFWTNARVALFAGATLGLLSKAVDLTRESS